MKLNKSGVVLREDCDDVKTLPHHKSYFNIIDIYLCYDESHDRWFYEANYNLQCGSGRAGLISPRRGSPHAKTKNLALKAAINELRSVFDASDNYAKPSPREHKKIKAFFDDLLLTKLF